MAILCLVIEEIGKGIDMFRCKQLHNILKPYYILVVLLLLWHIVSYLEIWNTYLLPTPWKVWHTFWDMFWDGRITISILVSLRRVLTGFVVSFVLAFVFALCAVYMPQCAIYFRHLNNFMRNVPPLSLISLLILWFGIGELPKLIVIVLASFFPMFLNIQQGFAGCDIKLIEVGKSMGFAPYRIFGKIVLPYAKQDILVGMRIGLGYCWRALIGAEMFAAASGLGYMIVYAQQMSRSDQVMIGIFLIGLIGCVSDKLFSMFIQKTCVGGSKND